MYQKFENNYDLINKRSYSQKPSLSMSDRNLNSQFISCAPYFVYNPFKSFLMEFNIKFEIRKEKLF